MNSTSRLTDDGDIAGWPARLFLAVFLAAWVSLHIGCVSFDGRLFGGPSVDVLEKPLNAAGAALGSPVQAGTILLAADKAIVGRQAKAEEFPLISVTTNNYDSKGTETYPPYRTVRTPVYGPTTNITTPQAVQPAPIILDAATMQQIAALWMSSQGKPQPVVIQPSPIATNVPTDLPIVDGTQPHDDGALLP